MSDGAPPLIRRVRWYHPPLALGGSVLLSVLVAGGFVVWHVLMHQVVPLALLAGDFNFGCIVTAAQEAGLLGLSLWLLSRYGAGGWPARFRRPSPRDLLLGLGAGVVVMLGAGLFTTLCDTLLHTHLGDDAGRLPFRPTSLSQLPLGLLVIAMLAPLAEESFFRGLFMGWLRQNWGHWPALIGQALLFGLVHMKWLTPGGLDGWLLTAELAGMGLVLGLVAWRSGNLWASSLAHGLNNGCAVLMLFFLPS